MGWSIGWDNKWKRDIGYGVPAYCDHPECNEEIDRGLSYVCGGQPYGGDRGCGLYFCPKHLSFHARLPQLCQRCWPKVKSHYVASPDHPIWAQWKLTDESWGEWRKANPGEVEQMSEAREA